MTADTVKDSGTRRHLPDQVDALPANMSYTYRDLVCSMISVMTYLFDVGSDVGVACFSYQMAQLDSAHNYWYFGLTVSFILLPSLIITGFSVYWYRLDADCEHIRSEPMWHRVLRMLMLALQLAPLLRYLDSMRWGMSSRRAAQGAAKADTPPAERRLLLHEANKYFLLMVNESSDGTLLRLLESFLESAPQIVLQVYILIRDPQASKLSRKIESYKRSGAPTPRSGILLASVVGSLISLAWSLVMYHRSLRYTFPEKNNLDLWGIMLQFHWHLCFLTARMLALALFACAYPQYIGVVCLLHWLIMFIWLLWQRPKACSSRYGQMIVCLAMAAIYLFSYFNVREGRTRSKYLLYYGFCFFENTALIVSWLMAVRMTPGDWPWYYYYGAVSHYLAFVCAIFFMLMYYTFCHPTGVDIDLGCFQKRVAGHSLAALPVTYSTGPDLTR